MAERQVGHWKSCLVLSERFPLSTGVTVLLLNQPKNISLGPRKGGCVRLIEKTAVCILYLIKTYNRRQNVLRHFILNWIFFYLLLTSKGGKISFPPLIPSMQCCAAVRATYRKQQTPQLWMAGTTEGWGFFCSVRLPSLSTMSKQFCRRLQVFPLRNVMKLLFF